MFQDLYSGVDAEILDSGVVVNVFFIGELVCVAVSQDGNGNVLGVDYSELSDVF